MENILKFARGNYQRSILKGNARLSGSDLKGKASRYSGRYRTSRENLLTRVYYNSTTPIWVKKENKTGRVTLIIGENEPIDDEKFIPFGTYLGIPLYKNNG